jgi:hypothetical protein
MLCACLAVGAAVPGPAEGNVQLGNIINLDVGQLKLVYEALPVRF